MSPNSAFKGKNDNELHFIGLKNATRWNDLKYKLECKNNVSFVTKLLDIATEYYNRQDKPYIKPHPPIKLEPLTLTKDEPIEPPPPPQPPQPPHQSHQPCWYCDETHSDRPCPLITAVAHCHVPDSDCDEANCHGTVPDAVCDGALLPYSYRSVPHCLSVRECAGDGGIGVGDGEVGVFCASALAQYVALGPLVGERVAAATIPASCDMRHVWTVYRRRCGDGEEASVETVHITTESDGASNWTRHVRASATRAGRNIAIVQRTERLYLVTVRRLEVGEELRYWDDTYEAVVAQSIAAGGGGGANGGVAVGGKRRAERRAACGGCGLRFSHPLHYRQHCLIHHDASASLTTRKYHCLVCGLALLGKERLRRHAQQAHQGRGAYQCQYCCKYFLRRNYLDVHRRYGCSRNPQRAKPLCDLCGKEFCQPQKLKVHIKRMHSEMADVLREFQCKRCLKVLGSRAALQRHLKEVHAGKDPPPPPPPPTPAMSNGKEAPCKENNQPEYSQPQTATASAVTCTKCGKQFQNKSNLKIHMLTHSGVKPFQCAEDGCTSAFTTKQCLQFHYRRVHGYQDGARMPRIERTVDYTLEAYSGSAIDSPPPPPPSPPPPQPIPRQPLCPSPILHHQPCSSSPIDDEEDIAPVPVTSTVVSKGSKKWIIDSAGNSGNSNSSSCGSAMSLLVDEEEAPDDVDEMEPMRMADVVEEEGEDDGEESDVGSLVCRSPPVTPTGTHHPPPAITAASAASLLVEAALDSVCSSSNNADLTATTPSLIIDDDPRSTHHHLANICPTVTSGGLYPPPPHPPPPPYARTGAGSVSPLSVRGCYGDGGLAQPQPQHSRDLLQLDLSIYKHYAASMVVDTVVRKYGGDGMGGSSGGLRSTQPDDLSPGALPPPPTDRFMRFLDNPPPPEPLHLRLGGGVGNTSSYSNDDLIDATMAESGARDLSHALSQTVGVGVAGLESLALEAKVKLDLGMTYYDTALEEIRSRLAAYESDMDQLVGGRVGGGGKGMLYGDVEGGGGGGGAFMLDGEFRSFEPFVLTQGGVGSPPLPPGSNADLQGVDMTSGCRTTAATIPQYTGGGSGSSSPGAYHAAAAARYGHPLQLHLPPLVDHISAQPPPPPRLYSPGGLDTGAAAADLSLRHHHDAAAFPSPYSPPPPPPPLGYHHPHAPPSYHHHAHYPQYY